MDENEAILHVLALLGKLDESWVSVALDEIDLSDEAWAEAVQVLKDKVGWKDSETA